MAQATVGGFSICCASLGECQHLRETWSNTKIPAWCGTDRQQGGCRHCKQETLQISAHHPCLTILHKSLVYLLQHAAGYRSNLTASQLIPKVSQGPESWGGWSFPGHVALAPLAEGTGHGSQGLSLKKKKKKRGLRGIFSASSSLQVKHSLSQRGYMYLCMQWVLMVFSSMSLSNLFWKIQWP